MAVKKTGKKSAPQKARKEPNKARPLVTEQSVAAAAAKAKSKAKAKREPTVERRAKDQDTAVEEAFVAATLPEEDRRAPEAPPEPLAEEKPVEKPLKPKKAAKKIHPQYEWIKRGDGTPQLYKDGQLCTEVPEEDRELVHRLLEEQDTP